MFFVSFIGLGSSALQANLGWNFHLPNTRKQPVFLTHQKCKTSVN